MSRGKLYNFCMLTVKRNQPFSFRLDKKNLPVGVSQLVLFDKAGQVLADRLVLLESRIPCRWLFGRIKNSIFRMIQ